MLTAAELESMRDTATDALPGTALIQRGTIVSNLGGGGSAGWQTVGTVPCRIGPQTGREMTEGARITSSTEGIVTLPAATVLDVNERLLIDGEAWQVTFIRPRTQEVTRRVEVMRVD